MFSGYRNERESYRARLPLLLRLSRRRKLVKCNTGVEVGYLAAKILKKPNVEQYGLAELVGEVGMDIKEPDSECPDWNAKVFSHEDVKYICTA